MFAMLTIVMGLSVGQAPIIFPREMVDEAVRQQDHQQKIEDARRWEYQLQERLKEKSAAERELLRLIGQEVDEPTRDRFAPPPPVIYAPTPPWPDPCRPNPYQRWDSFWPALPA